MTEVLNILFNPLPNAIMTLLTGLSLLYWLFTMLMGDGFDFGSDMNMDFDGADIQDIEGDAEVDSEPSFIGKAMEYINIGKAPLMVIVTLFKLIGWMITIVSSIAFKLADYGWKSIFILIPVLALTYVLMHYVTIPVVKLYQKVGYTGEEPHDYLGRTGKMRSSIKSDVLGSAEFIIQQDVIRLNVKSKDGEEIQYDDEVIIVDETPDKKYYYVQKNININNF
jgi:hypothetical protein